MSPSSTAQAHGRLLNAVGNQGTVYFCGLAKNTGKTVALRQVMAEARAAGVPIAMTSVGRDGEAYDAIYPDFAKPLLHFNAGDLVVTSESLLPDEPHLNVVVQRLGIRTPLGPLVLARVVSECGFEVAGPSTVAQLQRVVAKMKSLGAQLILVDGACDRKAAAFPEVCDGIVMSTGAALAASAEEVVLLTRAAIEMATSAVCGNMTATLVTHPLSEEPDQLAVRIKQLSATWPITLEIKGAVTPRVLDRLLHDGLFPCCRIVAESFSKLLVPRSLWMHYVRAGLNLSYRKGVRLLAVTTNPVSPMSPALDSAALWRSVGAIAPEIPVFDVLAAGYGAGR